MPATLKLDIVTPEAVTFSGDVEMVTLPALRRRDGRLSPACPPDDPACPRGTRRPPAGHDLYLAVGDGFVEVTNDHVAVLTDMAVPADQIDEAKAEEARRRAEARLADILTTRKRHRPRRPGQLHGSTRRQAPPQAADVKQ